MLQTNETIATGYRKRGGYYEWVHEILRNLAPGARVLDLGCRDGSFVPESYPDAFVVRLDRAMPPLTHGGFIQADAAHLPFADGSFNAIVSNHSLEHMDDLACVLREMGRVLRRDGSLYVAVPDASTFSDRLYRWIYHGGGHINAFRSAASLQAELAKATSLRPAATRVLCSSFGFLDRRLFLPRPPRRLWLLGNGHPKVIAALSYAARIFDRLWRTRWSVYGWAFYFGDIGEPVETNIWTNVCVHCGAAHPAGILITRGRLLKRYHCPECSTWNLFTKDQTAAHAS
jgi:SAM-dependent methyltransferase